MDYIEAPLKRFMAKYNRYEPRVRDSTARQSAKHCLRLYFFERVLGFRGQGQPAIYFAFGGAYHKFREVLENTSDFKLAIAAAALYWKQQGATDPPVGTKWDFLTSKRLLASCMFAKEWWDNEKKNGKYKVVAVEQIFQVLLSDNKTAIGGRADQIVEWNGKLWGRDFKTSSKMGKFYERTLAPNDQFTGYTLGEGKLRGERVEGQIVEVLYNTSKEGPKIIPYITSRTEDELKRWEFEQIFYEEILTLCREKDIYPAEETYCPFCAFHSVCKQSSEAAMMAQLDQFFVQKPWDFTKINQEVVDA